MRHTRTFMAGALIGLAALPGCLDTYGLSNGQADTSASEQTTSSDPTTGSDCDEDSICEPGEEACIDCAVCGDGDIESSELCDDGNQDNSDACVSGCLPASCGDGFIRADAAPELCDDGLENDDAYASTKHCNSTCDGFAGYCGDDTCQSEHEDAMNCGIECDPICGNLVLEAGEQCDTGEDSGDCDADCTFPMCGDGLENLAAGEACDDGNDSDTDDCTFGCVAAICGDGLVHDRDEVCDDGNSNELDECDGSCEPVLHRLVFVSSSTSTGNLGGLSGADAKCSLLAVSAGLPTAEFKAWLSDSRSSPAQRFDTTFTGVYDLVDGTPVAHGWASLTSAPLIHQIDISEDGSLVFDGSVWTNTLPDGQTASNGHCQDWSTSLAQFKTSVGISSAVDTAWTDAADGLICGSTRHLYCFEDP